MSIDSITRQEIEEREAATLAPYAALAGRSRGRVYPQEEHALRTAFQRDRDRIVHAAAFRRLEYKTQVFIPHETDHFRTRLTHTIEVAQISRTIARNLRLNEDLAEAIALVHDLGHTPFGHSGEDILDELLKGKGGFNHNWQSLRVVDVLEHSYAAHPGLNLSYEVREGIVKHETSVSIELPEFHSDEHPTLEAVLVDIADEIAYNSHDIDDGLSSGIIDFDSLHEVGIIKVLPELTAPGNAEYRRYGLVRGLIDLMATDVVEETAQRIDRAYISSLEDLRQASSRICGYSESMHQMVTELKLFLKHKLYRHERLTAMSEWAREIIETLFDRISRDPSLMPPRFRAMITDDNVDVVIADYIAGMTDRFAQKMYAEVD